MEVDILINEWILAQVELSSKIEQIMSRAQHNFTRVLLLENWPKLQQAEVCCFNISLKVS